MTLVRVAIKGVEIVDFHDWLDGNMPNWHYAGKTDDEGVNNRKSLDKLSRSGALGRSVVHLTFHISDNDTLVLLKLAWPMRIIEQ
jgi:hypothetical protein